MRAASQHRPAEGLAHLFEEYPNGYVDWTDGYYYGIGVGKGESLAAARRAAMVVAMREVLVVAGNIRVDSRRNVRALGGTYEMRIKGTVSDSDVVDEGWVGPPGNHQYEVVLQVPMYGVRGLAGTVYGKVIKRYRKRTRPERPPAADLTEAIVIDARGLGVMPAVFPRILAASGRSVYDVTSVPEARARENGIVIYATSDIGFEKLQEASSGKPTRRPAAQPAVRLLSADAGRGGLLLANADDKAPPRRRRRFERKRVVIKAEDVRGQLRTDVVLGDDDAQRLREGKAEADLLANGNVIIITDSSTAAIEGRLPRLERALAMLRERSPLKADR